MVNIFELLTQEKEKIEESNKLKTSLVEQKRLRDLDEADIWLKTDFKSLGATNDKMRTAIVTQRMNEFPNTYEQKKTKISTLEAEIKLIRDIIDVMKKFGVDEIDLENQNKTTGNTIPE